LSSDAVFLSPKKNNVPLWLAVAILATTPLSAQDDRAITGDETEEENATETLAPPSRQIIDLTVTVPKDEPDELLEEDCDAQYEAGIISNEIVVCRQLGESSDGAWNKEEWQRRYAERTQGNAQADVAGGGIFRGPATVSGLCVIPPCPPEAAIMIDVEALPQAPEGSDADRIAKGLPPLGRDPEPTPEEIAERRRALGLEAPPIPEQ